nr:PREDICTED: neuronal acetylcholine receptor subunit alpha-10-like [Struthio camelus australis]
METNVVIRSDGQIIADDQLSGSMETNVVIRSDGQIMWDSPAITKSSCKVDVSFFPFDEQQCHLTFGSWTYNGNQIDLHNRLDTGDLTDFVENVEWEVLGMPATRNVITYGCRLEGMGGTYMLRHVMTCACLAGKYYIATMTMITASTALTIFIMNIHHCGPGAKPVPRWAKKLILYYMARIFSVYEVGESCKSTRHPRVVDGRADKEEGTTGTGWGDESPGEGREQGG